MLGRSTAMRALDDALRASSVHPLLVPEPVRLTMIQLNKKLGDAIHQNVAFAKGAQLLACCMLGYEQFADSISGEDAVCVDFRVQTAFDEGDTLDAKLILLALHAGLMAPEIADRIDLEKNA